MSRERPTSPDGVRDLQLDIFADTRDVMLRNDLTDAIARRDVDAVRSSIVCLAAEFPEDHLLVPARRLAEALETEHADAVDASGPGAAVCAAAETVLGRGASHWLRPMWCAAARQRARQSWNAARPEAHAAPLWLAGHEWAQAAASIATIPSWRRIPDPLCWMVEARYHLDTLDETWPLLVELAWLSPRRLHALLPRLGDSLVDRLRGEFDREFDPDGLADLGDSTDRAMHAHRELAWFPAWLLCRIPAVAPHLARAEPGRDTAPERGLRLMVQLLHLEKRGQHHELMAQRQRLRELCKPLYEAYMATR